MASSVTSPLIPRIVVALAAALATLFLGASGATAAQSHHVSVAMYAYSPAALSVSVGDTVTWTNTDSVGHDITVTSGPALFHSPMLSKGQSWSYTFSTAGPYSYICSVHPDMRASITVNPSPVAAVARTTPQTPVSSMPGSRMVTVPAHSPQHVPASATTSAAPIITQSAAPSPTLSPLLLVSGAAVAAVVFCLLLLASRPITATKPETSSE